MRKMFVVPRYNFVTFGPKGSDDFFVRVISPYILKLLQKKFFSKTIGDRDLVLSLLTIKRHDFENDLKVKGQGRLLSFKVTVIIKITQKP